MICKQTKMAFQIYFMLTFIVGACLAQDDPQDIAYEACYYSSGYEFNTDTGVIESYNYPNDYYSSQTCEWFINPSGGIPDDQLLYLNIQDFETENGWDELWVYEGEGIYGDLLFYLDGYIAPGSYYALGSQPVTLYFTSDSSVTYPGFRVDYYFGEQSPGQDLAEVACDDATRPAYITTSNSTLIETIGYPVDHPDYTECEWIIEPEGTTEGMYLNVVYFYAYNYLYIYFDDNSNGDYETYWYGSYSNGYGLYNPGSVMTLYYNGYYNYPGFQLVYYPADPACTSGSASQITVDGKGEIKSPGYPYDVPEHVSCRWLLRAGENQKVIITALDQDLYGDGINCEDEYVEILDGDTVDALSLGKFCGNMTFGTVPSTGSSLQVYFRTHEDSTDITESHTGFAFNYEPADV